MPHSTQRFWQRVLTWSGPVLLAFCAASKAAEWLTERWWFESLGYASQFDHIMRWRGGAFLFGCLAFAIWLGFNAQIAWRNVERNAQPLSFFDPPRQHAFLRDKEFFDTYRRRLTVFVIALLAWLAGLGCAARYGTFLRAFNFQATGVADEASRLDLGFFLFQLPFLNWVSRFCMTAILAALALVVAIYLYEELIGPTVRSPRSSTHFSRHLAWLWGALLLWKGLDSLLFIPNSFLGSGNFTVRIFDESDRSFGWTSALALSFLTPFVAILSSLIIARRARLQTFLFGIGWMIAVSAIPFFLPIVAGRKPKIESLTRHIQSTRQAWGLDEVRREKVEIDSKLAWEESTGPANRASHLPVALWPSKNVRDAFNQHLEKSKNSELGRVEQVWLTPSNGQLKYIGLTQPPTTSNQDWRSRHLSVGQSQLLEVDATKTDTRNEPLFLRENKAVVNFGATLDLSRYSSGGALGNRSSGAEEFMEAVSGSNNWIFSSKTKETGVKASSWWARLAFALRFFDPGFLTHPLPDNEKVQWNRDAADRCSQLAPLLDWRSETASATVRDKNGSVHIQWLVTGLVWSDSYPNSASPMNAAVAPARANYCRQVAVGVIDAETGETKLYTLDDDEPFTALYRRAFPGLFRSTTSLANGIREAVQPSRTFLSAQSQIWARYHTDDGGDWADINQIWSPIFGSLSGSDDGLRAFIDNEDTGWLAMAFKSATGQASSKGPGTFCGVLGAEQRDLVDRKGRARFVEWAPSQAIDSPKLLTDSLSVLGSLEANLPLTTLAPRFDEQGRISGFMAAKGEFEDGNRPKTTDSQDVETGLNLTLGLWGAGTEKAKVTSKTAETAPRKLLEARQAWDQVLEARRKGNWDEVDKAENRLKKALNQP